MAKANVELAKVHLRLERWRHLGRTITGAGWIIACAVPIWAFQGVIEPLAGNTTRVNANIIFSATVAVSVVVNVGQLIKLLSQKSEIKRLRARVTDLENKLME